MIPLRLSFLLASLACAPLAWASSTFEFWPGATYDPSIPTQEAVLGHQPGEDITSPEDVRRYFDALAAAAPDRLRVVPYGRSWQGRELAYVIVTSPGNMARLTEIQAGMRELADPRRTGPARAGELLEGLPATTWLAYGVHGNELSSSDAAMLTAYHLLAATNDPRTASILADSVVYLDPDQNPDGRARFINHFRNTRGLQPAVSPVAAERIEPWPGGRSNHYLFDMNRDWYALTQPETRGRVTALRELLPLVFVDLHEMGGDSTYYFAPEAVPYNPHLVASQREALELFGRNNARWFDRFGIDYFTREVFDAFFPGYGASWPAYYGAVAMTYEQARVRGLAYRRYDGSLLHYRESVRNHFVTSLSTAEAAAGARKRLLTDFYAYRASAVEEGRREKVKGYAIPTQPDQSAADKLAGLLAMQGVEVGRATRPVTACGRDYASGSYFISKAQPAKRLLRVLLDRGRLGGHFRDGRRRVFHGVQFASLG
ncbi:MAG: M14 family zinc carboxypeptidase, partial [Steroidobacteraceae bacterium]